jgi:hypothetical protein
MLNLITCEWLRIRKTVGLAFFIHSFLLIVLAFFGLFNSESVGLKMSIILFYGLCGFLFGLVQMKKYTQSSRWTYFINRPIQVKKVYVSLLITTLLGFLIALAMPILLTTLVMDWSDKQVIDFRHYYQISYSFGMMVCFYLLATFITLSQKKSAILLLMIIILPLISLNLGGHVLWLLLGVISLLIVLNISVIKVNLDGKIHNQLLFITCSLSYQYALYFIMISFFFLFNEIKLDIDYRYKQQHLSQELNTSQQFKDLIFLPVKDLMVSALLNPQNSHHELIEEIKLNETSRIRKRVWFHPTRQQIPFMDENTRSIEDKENKIIWTFSHDLMLFVGKDQKSQQLLGYLGANTSDEKTIPEPFLAVPWIEYDQFISGNKIFRYLADTQSLQVLFSVDNNEQLLNVLQHQGSIKSVITTQNIYIIDSNDFDQERFPLSAKLKIPLPGDYNNLWDVNVTEVRDRFILTFLYGKSSRQDIYTAQQLTYEFDLSGHVKLINQRSLENSPPYIVQNLDFILSPAWKTLLDYFPTHPSRDRYLKTRPQVKSYSQKTLIITLVLGLISALLTWFVATKKQVSGLKKWFWIGLNPFFGLAGVISFLLLNEKKQIIVDELNLSKSAKELCHV